MVYHQRLRYLRILQDRVAGIKTETPRDVYSRTNPSFFTQTTDDEEDEAEQEEEQDEVVIPSSKMMNQTMDEEKREPSAPPTAPSFRTKQQPADVSEVEKEMDVVTEEPTQVEVSEPFDPLSLLASASRRTSVSIDVKSIIAFEEEEAVDDPKETVDKVDPLVDAKPFNELLSMQRTKINTAPVSRPSLFFARKKTKQEEMLLQTPVVAEVVTVDAKIPLKSPKIMSNEVVETSKKTNSTSVKDILGMEEEEAEVNEKKQKEKVLMDDDNDDDDDEEADFDDFDLKPKAKKKAVKAKHVEVTKVSIPLKIDTSTPKATKSVASTPVASHQSVPDTASAYDDYGMADYDQSQNFDNGHDSDEDSLDRFFATPAKAEPETPSRSSSVSKVSNQKAVTPSKSTKRSAMDIEDEDFLDNDNYTSSSRKTLGKASRQSTPTASSNHASSSKQVNRHQYDDNYDSRSNYKRGRYSNAAENSAEVSLRVIPITKRDLEWDDSNNQNGYNNYDSQNNTDYNDGSMDTSAEQLLAPTAPTTPRHNPTSAVTLPVEVAKPKPVELKTNKFFSKPKVQQMVIRPMEAIPTGQLFYCINKFQLLATKSLSSSMNSRAYTTVDEKPLLSKSLHVIQELQLKRNDLKIFHKFTPDIFDRYPPLLLRLHFTPILIKNKFAFIDMQLVVS